MDNFLIGSIAAMSLVIALFFLRFWRKTGDRFFLFFALSFSIEALNRGLMVSVGWLENSPAFYMIRLLAYSLIIVAILDKNRKKSP